MNILNNDDLCTLIYDKLLNSYENDIKNLENNLYEINKKIEKLIIKNNSIIYNNCYYQIDKYLFSKINEKIILINDPYIFGNQQVYISNILNNPTYFDILFEASKSIYETDNDCHVYLKKIKRLYHNDIINNLYNIDYDNNIIYYELILTSC
jgi:hypothetical protein